jgi:hypothetical protein
MTVYNNAQTLEDPDDEELALSVTNAAGTSYDTRLFKDVAFSNTLDTIVGGDLSGLRAMERVSPGVYESFYQSSSTDVNENIIFTFQYLENTYAIRWDVAANTDDTSTDLATIEAKVDTLDTTADAIKAVTDLLPDAGALSSLAQDSTVAKDATVAKELTLDGVETKVDTIDATVDAIKVVTDALPNAGTLSSLAQDSTVAKEATLDDIKGGSWNSATHNLVSLYTSVQSLNDLSPTDVASAVWDEATVGNDTAGTFGKLLLDDATTLATVDTNVSSVETKVDAIQADLDNGTDGLTALKAAIDASTVKYFEASITSAANQGIVVLGSVTTQKVAIMSVCLRSEGNTTADLTSAAIQMGPSGNEDRTILLPAALDDSTPFAVRANLDAASKQIGEYFNGGAVFNVGERIVVDLLGTGATAVSLTLIVGYRSVGTNGEIS